MADKPSMKNELLRRIEDRSAVIGVIGLGYVGLPLLHAFHRAGFRVMGFDVDPAKITALRRGENYLKHLGPEMVKEMVSAGRSERGSAWERVLAAPLVRASESG